MVATVAESGRTSLERAAPEPRGRRPGCRSVFSADSARARPALSRDVDVRSVRPRNRRWSVAPSGPQKATGPGRAWTERCGSRPLLSPDGSRVVVMIRKGGKGQLILVSADGSESRTLAAAIDAQGAADWRSRRQCDRDWGQRRAGPRALRAIPVDGGTPCTFGQGPGHQPRLVARRVSHRLRGARVLAVASRSRLCNPTARRSSCRRCRVAPGDQGHRFLPKGRASCIWRPLLGRAATGEFLDVWLQDLDTRTKRHLAHFDWSIRDTELRYHSRWEADRLRPRERQTQLVLIDIPR